MTESLSSKSNETVRTIVAKVVIICLILETERDARGKWNSEDREGKGSKWKEERRKERDGGRRKGQQ